eukprot:gene7688-8495_t
MGEMTKISSTGSSSSLSKQRVSVVLFSPGGLRIHDHPCLNYLEDTGAGGGGGVIPVVWPCEAVSAEVRLSLARKVRQAGGALLEASQSSLGALLDAIQQEVGASPEVVFLASPAEPMASLTAALVAVLAQKNCSAVTLSDCLFPPPPPPPPSEPWEWVYRDFHPTERMPSAPRLSHDGVHYLPALPGLRYLLQGERVFTARESAAYIAAQATTADHRQALRRLAPKHFFRGEVLSGLLAPLVAEGMVSKRLLLHHHQQPRDSLSLLLRRIPLLSSLSPPSPLEQEARRKDWHQLLASSSSSSSSVKPEQGWRVSFSYWRGYLQRLALMRCDGGGSGEEDNRPVALLVHGFGGSVDQYSALATHLAASRRFKAVAALDSLGFGWSEKPPLSFNQYLWRDQVVDAVRLLADDFAANRFVFMGNSIGGYTASSAAAFLSREEVRRTSGERIDCAGLVLFNPSGEVVTPSSSSSTAAVSPQREQDDLFPEYRGLSPALLSAVGAGIFLALQTRVRQTCEWLYAKHPQRVAESALHLNILRDSYDPGAPGLLAAGGKLPPPETMNLLFNEYTGPILLAQGVLDPLNNATARAAAFSQIPRVTSQRGVQVDLLDLGHCPMDEDAALVAEKILAWAHSQACW